MAESIDVYYISNADYLKLQQLASSNAWGSPGLPFESTDFDQQIGSMFPALQGCWYATLDEITDDELDWAEENGIVIGTTTFQNSGQSIGEH